MARRRAPLSGERVIAAAVALCDARGFSALTMRALAKELSVEPMSLYHHVANKEEILDGIVDAVFLEIEVPDDAPDWRAAMRARAASARAALTRHPWATPLLDSRTTPGVATLRHHNAVVGVLRRAGFSAQLAGHAFSVMDSYIYGFVLQQESMPVDGEEHSTAAAQEMFAALPVDEFPYLAEMFTEHISGGGFDFETEFAFGLDLILNGLEELRERED